MTDHMENLQPTDRQSLLRQLDDDDWHVRANAAFRLRHFPEVTLPEIARFFELALEDESPVKEICQTTIENMKSAAVPFLLEQTCANDAVRREQALRMLSTVGQCGGEPHKFADQVLGPRNNSQPGWGDHVEEVLGVVAHSLMAPEFAVRFAAASLLDDCNCMIEQTIPVFMEALSKGTPYQRNWAALRLGRIGPRAQVACESLAQLASEHVEQEDAWEGYASLAARVALKRINRGREE